MSRTSALRKGAELQGRPEELLPSAGAKPHICFVAPYAWPVLSRDPGIQIVGGAEVQQCVLARLFRRCGYRVSMITLDHGQAGPATVDGITVHKAFAPQAGIPVLRFLHPRMTSMWRAMQDADADIYYHRSSAMLTAVVAQFARRNGKRSIYAGASDMDFVPGKEQISLARDRWLFHRGIRSVDHIVVQNRVQLETCKANYAREATLIPSSYELPEKNISARVAEDKNVVLWCGTVHKYKQPEILLEIARRLPQRSFVMVGGPGLDESAAPYYPRIAEQAKALRNVTMTGFLPLARVEPWFDRAKVFVLTSVYEGMPNVFLQAWARGIPTVATVDVGARIDGQPIYRIFSKAEEAQEEIERLMEDPAYWARRSAQVREYFERTHSSAEVMRRYAGVFDSLMDKGR
jgi:glycosyltransferase involved in cell wall biosynthesis